HDHGRARAPSATGQRPSPRRPVLALERCDKRRQPFCKFIAAGQIEPALLHFEIIPDRRWVQEGFSKPPACLRMTMALAEPPRIMPLRSAICIFNLGSARPALTSWLSLPMIPAGVPAGAPRPKYPLDS